MKIVNKLLIGIGIMALLLFAGMHVGDTMANSFSDPHNGWYCNGDDSSGQCDKNSNVTCCNNFNPGCEDVACTDPGEI